MQDLATIPFNEEAKAYLLEQGLGYEFFKVPLPEEGMEIDRYSGRPINPETGTYQLSHLIEGKVYTVNYYPSGSPDCLANNCNMVKDEASDAFITATSAKALDDASTLATYAALPARAGTTIFKTIDHTGKLTSFGSAFLDDTVSKQIMDEGFSNLTELMLKEHLGKHKAEKVQAYLSASGLLDPVNDAIPTDKENRAVQR
ncbi:hypothetical protein F0231_01270 [Vibrio sp. RE86]|uniref:hypothetical protein n=1 Tax=Vibrio sp. RE86 TaxID=2607605 RepID=UPI0014939C5A|nr:hypothetical protein [Vibrio sp. RE86]NOH78365.1 hypothetical protein [Vibrio sp. RE86]